MSCPELATSVPLGASRLTRDWLHEDPPSAKSVKELRRYIRTTLKPAVRKFEKLGRANLVAGTSKTFRSLARIAGAAPSAAGPYVKRELQALDLGVWAQRISAMKVEDRLYLPGVSEARAHQLLAGALVAEAALEMFKFKRMMICPWALREGLILRRLDQLVFAGPLDPAPHVAEQPPARLQSPEKASLRQLGNQRRMSRPYRSGSVLDRISAERPAQCRPIRQGGTRNDAVPAQHLPAGRPRSGP